MLPPAPGRFSAITCWPSALVSWSAITRARMSVDWPGGKGTMMRIGLVGQACAKALGASAAVAPSVSARRRLSIAGFVAASGRLLVLLRGMFAGDLEEV